MSRLSENREDMQTIVEAMAAVLDIEVTIYDDNMEVIASTGGNMHNKVGIQVRGYVLKKVMKQKKLFVNDQPGKSKLCKKCSMLDGQRGRFLLAIPANKERSRWLLVDLLPKRTVPVGFLK